MLTDQALLVLKERYALAQGETWKQVCHRVAYAVASSKPEAEEFETILTELDFIPAGRTLKYAGTPTKLVSNCVVLHIPEGKENLVLEKAVKLHSAGSGVGFPYHQIRPAELGQANGPIAVLKKYSTRFKAIEEGSRPPANMALLRVDHPDILEFLEAKTLPGVLENYNISISLTDEFMNRVLNTEQTPWICRWNDKPYKPREILRDQKTNTVLKITDLIITPAEIFKKICYHAWNNGEPGCIFIDTVNKTNPLPGLGPIECCNPCGEQFLHSGDACNLGSINLEKIVCDNQINWLKLENITRLAVRFLDNVIDLTEFPVEEVQQMFTQNRRIGLGVMGVADMLILLNKQYNTPEARAVAEAVVERINQVAHDESSKIAQKKGNFPNWDKSIYRVPMRNASLTTIAPTGSISILASVSSGLEPYFARDYIRCNKILTNKHVAKGFDVITSLEIEAKDHIKMQACLQKHIDNSISKTINLPTCASVEDVAKAFQLAWVSKCKGITVYRNNSRADQVLCTICALE
jgi:ribonucleoside-diphosphate reductase alpha chain